MKNKINLIFWLYGIAVVLIFLDLITMSFISPLFLYFEYFTLLFLIFACTYNFILSVNIYKKKASKKIKKSNLYLLIITSFFLFLLISGIILYLLEI